MARPDPYAWMRRLDASVVDHLGAERKWYDVATGHLGPLVQALRSEMTARVPATDSSVSTSHRGYSYRTLIPAGREYVQLLRRRHDGGPDAAEELLLDVNDLADESGYVELGLTVYSPGRPDAGLVGRPGR